MTIDLDALAKDLYENGFGGSNFLKSGEARYLYTKTDPEIEVSSAGSVYIEDHLMPKDDGWQVLEIIRRHIEGQGR